MTEPLHTLLPEALFAIRNEVGTLPRDSENPHFKSRFTSLPVLVERVDPVAWAHGVFLHHALSNDDLIHELWFNGELQESYSLPLPNAQGTAQGLGSAITYLRRYDYVTTFGLTSETDDDGHAASELPVPATVTRPSPRQSQTNADGLEAVRSDF